MSNNNYDMWAEYDKIMLIPESDVNAQLAEHYKMQDAALDAAYNKHLAGKKLKKQSKVMPSRRDKTAHPIQRVSTTGFLKMMGCL